MNRLADETSPYLQQHAHNPVDWYPWGEEALSKARDEDKPIFLSVGYSACHWCHVMERESFEDEAIAAYLNEHFVSVKVDREERPDIDNIYMEAVQVMTGQGGWPMTVFIDPASLEPFFCGTYFPPEDRWGRPGFPSLLEQLHAIWKNDREKCREVGGQVRERLENMAQAGSTEAPLTADPIDAAFIHFDASFDEVHAGFGQAPKFPPSMGLRLLLHIWAQPGMAQGLKDSALEMVERTLVHMASGGMYDQLGGGFHRYSVDREWLVPHFEKMLYDNALLTAAYTEAYQATGREFYARIVDETCTYLLREMTFEHASGRPFYSTMDADSEGVEGKFFVWTPAEVREVLGHDAEAFCAYYGIRDGGNFEGRSIPNRLHAVLTDGHAAFEPVPQNILEAREKLRIAREERIAPGTDTKILAAWNGLMIGAMARAGAVFERPEWIDAASSAARFVLDAMVDSKTGRLQRTYKDERARFDAYLDDYANMACGLLDLFEASSRLEWLDAAENLVEQMNEEFWDKDESAFFYTADHHENLLVRQKESYDAATPSSNSKAVEALLRLAAITSRNELRDRAERVLKAYNTQMTRSPRSLDEMLQSLDWHLQGPHEIVLRTPEGATSLAAKVWKSFLYNAVILNVPEAEAEAWTARLPLLEGKGPRDGKATVYVCREGTCEAPRHEW